MFCVSAARRRHRRGEELGPPELAVSVTSVAPPASRTYGVDDVPPLPEVGPGADLGRSDPVYGTWRNAERELGYVPYDPSIGSHASRGEEPDVKSFLDLIES